MHLPFPEGTRGKCTNLPFNEIQLGSLYLDGPGRRKSIAIQKQAFFTLSYIRASTDPETLGTWDSLLSVIKLVPIMTLLKAACKNLVATENEKN